MMNQDIRRMLACISTMAISAMAVVVLLHASNAYAIGNQYKIDGDLLTLEDDLDATLAGVTLQNPSFSNANNCVSKARLYTGFGAKAINYQASTLSCFILQSVDGSHPAGGWCSQWIVPNSPDYCTVPTGGGGGGGSGMSYEINIEDYMWGGWSFCGGGDYTVENRPAEFKIVVTCGGGGSSGGD